MARDYSPKVNPLSSNRLLRIIKETVDRANKEELLVQETYDYFKELVENNVEGDHSSKSAMIDCLKILQNSKVTISKLVATAAKINSDNGSNSKSKNKESEIIEDFFENLT